MKCLHTILGISQHDHVTNDEVPRRSKLQQPSDIVRNTRLEFTGHRRYYTSSGQQAPPWTAWVLEGGKRSQRRHGEQQSKKTLNQWNLVGEETGMTADDGENSSPKKYT